MASLLTRHGCLRNLHRIGMVRMNLFADYANEEEEPAYHVVFECAAMEWRRLDCWNQSTY